jgi:hypothetical protein
VAERLAGHGVSVARLVQHQLESGAAIHLVTHVAQSGAVEAALAEIAALPEVRGTPTRLAVISDRGAP